MMSLNRNDTTVLISFTESAAAGRAVELACRFAPDTRARLIVAYVIEVPLDLRLDAPLPTLEEKAQVMLAIAASMVKKRGLTCETRIVRDRSTGAGLVQLATDVQASMLVMGVAASLQSGLGDLVTVSDLFRRAPCEVVVAKAQTQIKQEPVTMGQWVASSIGSL